MRELATMKSKNTSIALFSINSPYELTGGGHYLRSLIHGYCNNSNNVCVIGKKSSIDSIDSLRGLHYKEILFSKTILSDLVSRFMLSINFLSFYILRLIKIVTNYDVLAFHSSRFGVLIMVLKLIFPNKTILCHFDNVEKKLLEYRVRSFDFSFRYFLALYDYLLAGFTESLAVRFSDKLSFITTEDSKCFNINESYIIPICFVEDVGVVNLLEQHEENDKVSNNSYILFTASFDFEPNIEALEEIKEISRQSSCNFLIAGRCAEKFTHYLDDNFQIVPSPSVEKMDSLFRNAGSYICSVRSGSGMKTKVAEAMRYGLSVLSTEHSLIGYEDVVNKPYIRKYKNVSDACTLLENSAQVAMRQEVINDFKMFYSTDRVDKVLKEMLL